MAPAPGHCPRCDAPLKGSESACPQCKRPLLASVPQKEIKCPVCKIKAYAGKLNDLDGVHCAECESFGIPRETLMKLMPQGEKKFLCGAEESAHKTPPYFTKRDRPPFLICPYCGKRMKEDRFGPMKADICESCDALWLEKGRFEHLDELLGPYKWRMMKKKDEKRR